MSKQVYFFKMHGCGPCTKILPLINDIGQHYAGPKVPNNKKVRTFVIDIKDNPGMAAIYSVDATPTTIFLYNNEVISRVEGGNQQEIENSYYKLFSL